MKSLVSVIVFAVAMSFLINGSTSGLADDTGAKLEALSIESGGTTHRFDVEIARTEAQQRLGLMYRTSLAKRSGMLFPYDSPQEITMWMRNTRISLDMIFIAKDGRIVRIAENTEPYSLAVIASKGPASAVLEVNAGVSRELGLKPGDRVRHPFFSGTP